MKRVDIGVNYLTRWYVIPRNRFFNIYLHRFLGDDDDRALHCHPWDSFSIRLKGELREYYKNTYGGQTRRLAPRFAYRRAEFAHRLELIAGKPAWTLFITGPRRRPTWFFHCQKGLVPWYKMTNLNGDKLGSCDDH